MDRGIVRFQMQASQQQYFNSTSTFDGATVVVETLLSRNDLIAIYLRKTCLTADFTPCFIGRKDLLAVGSAPGRRSPTLMKCCAEMHPS